METKKNYFTILLNALGIILFTIALFFGLNVYFNGNLLISIPLAVFIGLLMELIVYNMCKLKVQIVNQHKSKPVRITLFCLYIIIAIVTAPIIAHIVNISFNNKTKIQAEYNEQEDQFNRLFTTGETISYDSYVTDRLDWYYEDLGNKKIEGAARISAIDQAKDALMKDYNEILSEKNTLIPLYRESVNSWNLFTINSQLSQWDQKKGDWINRLIESSKNHEVGVSKPFEASLSNNENLSSSLTTISLKELAWGESILLIIVLHLMILFQYIAIKSTKQGKIKGKKDIRGIITY